MNIIINLEDTSVDIIITIDNLNHHVFQSTELWKQIPSNIIRDTYMNSKYVQSLIEEVNNTNIQIDELNNELSNYNLDTLPYVVDLEQFLSYSRIIKIL